MTSIRGIAATWVVAYHLINNLVYRGWLDRPNAIIANIIEGGSGFAVDIFFVLSGYILATTYGVKSDFPTFIVNRIARVFPLHVIVLTAMVAGIIVMRQFGFFPENEDFFLYEPFRITTRRIWRRTAISIAPFSPFLNNLNAAIQRRSSRT